MDYSGTGLRRVKAGASALRPAGYREERNELAPRASQQQQNDAKFIRGFFNVYYRAAFWAALGASISYALWGRFGFAVGAAGLVVIAVFLRRHLLSAMQQLGAQIQANADGAIHRFRRVHVAALLINLAQLVVLVWGTLQLSKPA